MSTRTLTRYVALGDSTTEGLDDPDGQGGYRGWADRFAEQLALWHPGVEYANLAVRGRLAAQIHAEQLAPALAMRPDISTVVAGMNDLLRPSFDADLVAGHIEAMQRALVGQGATVLTFTLPDLGRVMPVARLMRGRVLSLNAAIRAASQRSGAVLLDLAANPVSCDPRLWSADRLHANAEGHRRIAAALCHAASLPGADATWSQPLPPAARRRPRQVAAAEWAWTREYLGPWVLRRIRGQSSGDGVVAKRPDPLPLQTR